MRNSPPSVYLIILTWNNRDVTLEAVESVLRTDYPNFRLVVVDNASTDGTAEAIKAAYPAQVHLIENSENLLFAGGNNVGIEYALSQGADYVCILNNDITVDKKMASELVRALEENPDAGMAGPMMYYHPPKGEGREVIWYAGGIVSFWRGYAAHRGIRELDRGQYAGVSDTGYISGCVLMARAGLIRKIGLLDPGYRIYGEDNDWCARAKEAGARLLFVPAARMWHKVSASSGGRLSPYKVYYKLRGNLRFFRRHARPWHWLTIPFFVAAGAAAFVMKSLVQGRTGDVRAFLRGLFSPRRIKRP